MLKLNAVRENKNINDLFSLLVSRNIHRLDCSLQPRCWPELKEEISMFNGLSMSQSKTDSITKCSKICLPDMLILTFLESQINHTFIHSLFEIVQLHKLIMEKKLPLRVCSTLIRWEMEGNSLTRVFKLKIISGPLPASCVLVTL